MLNIGYNLLTVIEENLAYYLQFQAIKCKPSIEITQFSNIRQLNPCTTGAFYTKLKI